MKNSAKHGLCVILFKPVCNLPRLHVNDVGPCTSLSAMALPIKKTHMKSVKSATAMKAMKAMRVKKKTVSKIAKGKGAKFAVFKGKKEKTASGQRKEDLIPNKRGRIVSKKTSEKSKKIYEKYLSSWNVALHKAREELGIKGFCAVNGNTVQGKALYVRTKAIWMAWYALAVPAFVVVHGASQSHRARFAMFCLSGHLLSMYSCTNCWDSLFILSSNMFARVRGKISANIRDLHSHFDNFWVLV